MNCKENMECVSRVSEKKAQHPGISMAIVKSFSTFLDNHLLKDFKVTVEGDTYSCHSCVLASCSGFFNGLLWSERKEEIEMKVDLCNISSPIFQLILKTLYTGEDLLTTKNVLQVWSAVHQLQIQFLIDHCEEFVINNLSLDNLGVFKEHAEYLRSEKVFEYIFNFILTHFKTIREQELFLQMDFPYLIQLLRSDKLVVRSEDEVLYSIIDWVKYGYHMTRKMGSRSNFIDNKPTCVAFNICNGQNLYPVIKNKQSQSINFNLNNHSLPKEEQPDSISEEEPNERKQFLYQLLNATRYYVASKSCILSLYKDKLIQSDIPVKECLLEALTFKFCNRWHNYCPTKSVPRDSCGIEHVGVFCDKGSVSAFSFKREKWVSIKSLPLPTNAKLTNYKGKLYACENVGNINSILVLEGGNRWLLKSYTGIIGTIDLLIPQGDFIYMLSSFTRQMVQFNPDTSETKIDFFSHTIDNMAHALVHNNNIVVFSYVNNNKGEEETAVRSWNAETKVWTRFDNLQLCAKNMTSFCNDRDTYILERNGNLWKLANSDTFGLSMVVKMWNGKHAIKGALLFRESLFIFGHFPNDDHRCIDIGGFNGVFTSVKFLNVALTASHLTHYVIPMNELPYSGYQYIE